jgi:hypothetical protein
VWAHPRLAGLAHSNGAPLLRVFGAHGSGAGAQGGIFNFLVLRPDGSVVAATQVGRQAGGGAGELVGG